MCVCSWWEGWEMLTHPHKSKSPHRSQNQRENKSRWLPFLLQSFSVAHSRCMEHAICILFFFSLFTKKYLYAVSAYILWDKWSTWLPNKRFSNSRCHQVNEKAIDDWILLTNTFFVSSSDSIWKIAFLVCQCQIKFHSEAYSRQTDFQTKCTHRLLALLSTKRAHTHAHKHNKKFELNFNSLPSVSDRLEVSLVVCLYVCACTISVSARLK